MYRLLICDPAATSAGLNDEIEGTGLDVPPPPPPPPQLGKATSSATNIITTRGRRRRDNGIAMKHAPSIIIGPLSPHGLGRSPVEMARRDCPIAVVLIVSVEETLPLPGSET